MEGQKYQQWVEDTREFWDAETDFDAKYRRICSDPEIDSCTDEERLGELWQKRTEEELDQLTRGIPISADWTCLEIGCGIGRLLKPIAEQCEKVIGIDISEKMVTYAADYLSNTPNATVHQNDGLTLSMIEDQSVDWVFSHLAFQHMTLQDIVDSYLSEINRVLKPGGFCRIQCWREAPTPAMERFKNVVRAIIGRETYHGPRRWLWQPGKKVQFGGITYHPDQWRNLLEDHGLEVIDLQLGVGHDYWMWTTSRKP